MDYSKFYTPPKIAELLVEYLNIPKPSQIIDICCGSCNLLYAARERWPNAKLIGVDIASIVNPNIHCIQEDGRAFALNNMEKYSLVLANPPFDSIKDRRQFPDLYKDIPQGYSISRLEIEMLLANLHLLDRSGILVIIMPSTFVNAERNRWIRKYISSKYHVLKIFRLPEETFGAAKINSYALFIKRENGNCRDTEFFCVTCKNSNYNVSNSSYIELETILLGDWDKDFMKESISNDLEMRRGTVSSHYFAESGYPILHTAKMRPKWEPSIRYISKMFPSLIYAEDGDIIVNRIGNAAGQWYRYTGKEMPISDCLYRIKDPQGKVLKVLQNNLYSSPLKGLAVRYITIADFKAWYQALKNSKCL